jgi:hypothetical protein
MPLQTRFSLKCKNVQLLLRTWNAKENPKTEKTETWMWNRKEERHKKIVNLLALFWGLCEVKIHHKFTDLFLAILSFILSFFALLFIGEDYKVERSLNHLILHFENIENWISYAEPKQARKERRKTLTPGLIKIPTMQTS